MRFTRVFVNNEEPKLVKSMRFNRLVTSLAKAKFNFGFFSENVGKSILIDKS